jgi:signal transduction histidine kinase/CheY-like chemotaxis protein
MAGRRSDLQREARVIARLVATRVEGGLEKHLTAMRQMANFYASTKKVTDKSFHAYAAKTLQMNPACLNIVYLDPAMRILQSHPPDAGQWRPILDARSHPLMYATVTRAARTLRPMLSPPMQLFGGTWGFVLVEPVVAQHRLLGELVGACRSKEYFDSLVPSEVSERYESIVIDSGREIFASDPNPSSDLSVPSVSEDFDFGGLDWEVRIRPQEQVIHDRMTAGRSLFWTIASLLALALGALASAASFWAMAIAASLRSERAALLEVRSSLDGTKEQLIQAEKMTALGQLVAGVAHEINNPLTGIVGYSQLLMKQSFPPDVQKKLLTISLEADRMSKIVRNLLAFARHHAPEKKVLDLNRIIDETLALKGYHLRSRQIKVVKDLDPGLPKTLLDFNQMEQILINLLNNAEQAMIEARRGRTITLKTRVVESRIELRVSDDGPGISQEIQERIFEPFFTTKKEGSGTGLGLSLCYGIVEEHGGKIRVESQPGEGATFIVDLPITEARPADSPEEKRSTPTRVPRMKVLVIDDEQSVRDFLVDLLTLRGHSVERASDVPEAVQKIAAGAHDLIITDVMMPQGTARDIYDAVLRCRPHLARRIVFTTGHVTNEDALDFLRSTGNELVLKPWQIDEMEKAIARAARN